MTIVETREEEREELSTYIRLMRGSVHWSLAKLAKHTGYKKSTIHNYESEHVYPRNVDHFRQRIQKAVAAEQQRLRSTSRENLH